MHHTGMQEHNSTHLQNVHRTTCVPENTGCGHAHVKTSPNIFLEILFWKFASIRGVQGAIPECPELIPELNNDQICNFLKKHMFSDLGALRAPKGDPKQKSLTGSEV